QSDKVLVPLSHEMQIVRAYLEVEQSRLGNRLRVETEVAEDALHVPIPVLSIQPLVENAIKHGVARRTQPGDVRIEIACTDQRLRVWVENRSAGSAPLEAGTGVGLQNVRRRLEICYGTDSTLDCSFGPEIARVEFCVPLPAAVTAGDTLTRGGG